MASKARTQLRALIARTLWHDGLMHVMSPEDLADAVLNLGETGMVEQVIEDLDTYYGFGTPNPLHRDCDGGEVLWLDGPICQRCNAVPKIQHVLVLRIPVPTQQENQTDGISEAR